MSFPMPNPDYGLKPETIDAMRAVFRQHPEIEAVILYGSRAKGTFRNGSDIDLTLTGTAVSQQLLYQLLAELDDLLLPYTIDLSIFAQISNPDLIDHIQRRGVRFY
jgi:predicted nucleotidyltransferase